MTIDIKKRKSKFDLSECAFLKVSKAQYEELSKLTDNTNLHWSEYARLILQKYISTGLGRVGE